jgi:DNA-binding winged helix-turn-helix (wHTH) protein
MQIRTLNATDWILTRDEDIAYIMECVADGECCSIVGVSNMGKSVLLRSVCRPEVKQRYLGPQADADYAFVYIDFNLMLEMTEQGFYELVLRNILAELAELGADQGLLDRLNELYRSVVNPTNPFMVPLSFNEGMTSVSEGLGRRVVLLFDEFDEAFQGIEGRVFLNLRALRDKYRDTLCYVVATEQRLRESRRGPEIAEFCELFAHNVRFLSTLKKDDAIRVIKEFDHQEELDFSPQDIGFILAQAGGHPGLLEVVCRLLGATLSSGETQLYSQDERYKLLEERLGSDLNVRTECAKLWNDLTGEEQNAIVAFLSNPQSPLEPGVRRSLCDKCFLIEDKARQLRPFGRLFEGFAHRQRLVKEGAFRGVRVDIDAGEVWVDGQVVPTLTNLEYRLLLLLYGNMDKICDKYQVVEAVWGEEYIEEVDDARIDKLVSRLRQKIEPELSNPRYLVTVRERGYKLVSS